MHKFIITIDSSCDNNLSYLKDNDIHTIFFKYSNEKEVLTDTMDEKGYKAFYQQMRNGTVFKTSQINPLDYYDFFKPLLSYNLPIIHISLGSGLSNTINSVFMAINQLKEDYENVDIKPIDSKFASLGLTLLLDKLIEYRNEGLDASSAYEKILEVVDNVTAYFTTDTLTYFARGGRLSKVSAFIGNAIKINPILDVDPEGKLRIVDKIRGTNHALDQLVRRCKASVIDANKQTVLICHADNEIKAELIGKRLVDELHFKDYKTYFMGPIVGAHTGPGLISVFFFGKKREYSTSLIEQKEVNKLVKEMNRNSK